MAVKGSSAPAGALAGTWVGSLGQRVATTLALSHEGDVVRGTARFTQDVPPDADAQVIGEVAGPQVVLRFSRQHAAPGFPYVDGSLFQGKLDAAGTLTGTLERGPGGEPVALQLSRR